MTGQQITWRTLHKNWILLVLLAPTIIGVGLFSYVPAIEAVRHSFYNWDGAFTEEYTGLANLRKILGDLTLWTPLLLGGLLAGLSAVLDKSIFSRALRWFSGGLLVVTAILMFRDSSNLADGVHLYGTLTMLVVGLVCGALSWFLKPSRWLTLAKLCSFLLPFMAGVSYLVSGRQMGDQILWMSFNLILILVVANLLKMLPSIFTAVCIHRLKSDRWQYWYRVLFVVPMIIPQMVGLLVWKYFYDPNVGVLNKFLITFKLDVVLMWLDKWVLHLGVFNAPFKPAWLGDPSLIIPALIFWGFPWVGVVGVLIYLAGLQNIGADVYEAAEIDGIGWWGKFWQIELPLIMTQVRLNLILMIISTFQAYGFQYVLLGAEGGPQNKGMTPGLYMFYSGFQKQNYGYACAIGLILFFIILILTIINQRYVRVKK